jgi:hypothetical protein
VQFSSWSPGGVANLWEVDPEDGSLLMRRLQDVSPFLERNHQIREHGNWRGEDNDFWHAASIPNVILEKWFNEGITKSVLLTHPDDWPVVRRLLNGEYKYLKTMPKNI